MTLPTVLDDAGPDAPATARGKPSWSVPIVLRALASLRVTVVLFVFSLILVFCGTLAQVDEGIWTVVNKYFRSALVWIPFQVFFPRRYDVPGGFPFPGGWTLGALLLVNLLAAHLVRFQLTWKRSGILVLHAGLIVMLVGELLTGLYAVEGSMTIPSGQESNYLVHHHHHELAVLRQADEERDDVVVVPDKLLRRGGTIRHELLPFDLEVREYLVNSVLRKEIDSQKPNLATTGDGLLVQAVEKPEVSGVAAEQTFDVAAAYVTVRRKSDGEALGTYLLTPWLEEYDRPPQRVTVDGQTYEIALRFKRTYKPYTVQLIEFRHDRYIGTDKPKNFSSLVRLKDPEYGTDREALIYMNNPLRYRGETFYQQAFLPGDRGTILQVVRNPSWLLPYVSCALVSCGMLFHFGMNLVGFLRRRGTR